MGILEDIHARARRAPTRIVLSEGEDPRIVEGALRAARDGLTTPSLVGHAPRVAELLRENGAAADALTVIDPATSDWRDPFAEAYHDLRKHKGMTFEKAQTAVQNPLVFAAMMVRLGHADGTIGGAVSTTGDTIR
ncbi:MAG: phosphate acyltransferase, partial [Pseudomonadota bacterium]